MRHTVLRFKQAIVITLALGLVSSPVGLQFHGASESFAQTPPAVDSAQQRCDELAGDPRDPSQVGRGVRFAEISVTEALPACQAAANVAPVQPHYQFLYGRVLQKAERYYEAFQQYNSAAAGGVAGAMHNLGVLYEHGLGVTANDAEAQGWYRRAEQARRAREVKKAGRSGGGLAESDREAAIRNRNVTNGQNWREANTAAASTQKGTGVGLIDPPHTVTCAQVLGDLKAGRNISEVAEDLHIEMLRVDACCREAGEPSSVTNCPPAATAGSFGTPPHSRCLQVIQDLCPGTPDKVESDLHVNLDDIAACCKWELQSYALPGHFHSCCSRELQNLRH